MRKSVIMLMLVAAMASLSSCGYRLSGTGALVPEGTKTIAVPSFLNNTNEPYVDLDLTAAVIREFITDGRLRVVDVAEADLVLRGRVVKYEAIPVSYTPDSFVQQYRVRMVVDASLEDLRTKKVLWKEKGIEAVFISDYPVAYVPKLTPNEPEKVDITGTKIAKDAALKKASQDIAWTLRSRVLEGF